jgi:Cu2+-containing amine oxidase
VRRLNITGGDELIVIFYSGEYGMGTMANELSLGCDCLGQIHYLVLSPTRRFGCLLYSLNFSDNWL